MRCAHQRTRCQYEPVSYFTAVLVPRGRTWVSCDASLDDVSGLDELVGVVRGCTDGDTALAVLEREDEWFAVVRVDGDDDARVFVSDLPAARQSSFGPVFADPDLWSDAGSLRAAGLLPQGYGEDGYGGDEDEDEVADEDRPKLAEVPWAGDLSLLEDLGLGGAALKDVVEADADDPAAALTEIGERVGFLDLLEQLR